MSGRTRKTSAKQDLIPGGATAQARAVCCRSTGTHGANCSSRPGTHAHVVVHMSVNRTFNPEGQCSETFPRAFHPGYARLTASRRRLRNTVAFGLPLNDGKRYCTTLPEGVAVFQPRARQWECNEHWRRPGLRGGKLQRPRNHVGMHAVFCRGRNRPRIIPASADRRVKITNDSAVDLRRQGTQGCTNARGTHVCLPWAVILPPLRGYLHRNHFCSVETCKTTGTPRAIRCRPPGLSNPLLQERKRMLVWLFLRWRFRLRCTMF